MMSNDGSSAVRKKFWGTVSHKPRWGLTWKGRLVILLAILALVAGCFFGVEPFLSVTHRENTKILVVEGWVSTFAIRAGVSEFVAGSYDKVFATGGPVLGNGGYINDQNTTASIGAQALVMEGAPKDRVQMVPSHVSGRDRTYSSALALREWFHAHDLHPKSINVLTVYAHARRTRLLFQEAFGDEVKVGIIAVENPDYDAKYWWHYSDGVKEVMSEGIAYIYARVFFHPEPVAVK